jgi:hypothetical protein
MVVNQLECCGINNTSSLKKKKMVVNETHASTEISFVMRSPYVVVVVPVRSPYTWLGKLKFFKGFLKELRVELLEFLTSLVVKNSLFLLHFQNFKITRLLLLLQHPWCNNNNI